jgi:hypothetical protein
VSIFRVALVSRPTRTQTKYWPKLNACHYQCSVLQLWCSVLFSEKLFRSTLRMANLVTTWCQMYIRSSLQTRSDANSPFSCGQNEIHTAVRLFLDSSSVLTLCLVLAMMQIALVLFVRWVLKFDLMYVMVWTNQKVMQYCFFSCLCLGKHT